MTSGVHDGTLWVHGRTGSEAGGGRRMKFVTIREFRNETAKIRKDLEAEREVVLTANGRPFALLSRVEPDSVEDEVLAVRRARARIAIDRMRAQAKARGLDKMTMEDVDAFIADVRRRRRASR